MKIFTSDVRSPSKKTLSYFDFVFFRKQMLSSKVHACSTLVTVGLSRAFSKLETKNVNVEPSW